VIKEQNFLSINFELKYLGKPDIVLNIKLLGEEENSGVIFGQSYYKKKVFELL
jgi:hypothetical protein